MTDRGARPRWLRAPGDVEATTPVPAATVVLLRDAPGGLETLMMRKDSRLAFGGMWVFPGGKVDEADWVGIDPDDEVAAARVAAAREAAEEASLVVDPTQLVPMSFWLPPPEAPKRFATWFFVAEAPAGAVTVDGGEITDHRWVRPSVMLEQRDRSEVELAPPTWVTLHRLAHLSRVADALGAAEHADIERFETRIAEVEGVLAALWEGDAGYSAGDGHAPGARHRLVMDGRQWRYERS